MAIAIRRQSSGVIDVTGDIETLLIASYVKRGQPFVLSFSDGTLIEGSHDPATGETSFQPLVEGAGILMKEEDGMRLLWPIEWATIAPMSGVIIRDFDTDPAPAGDDIDDDEHVGSVAEW
jgi:hypothetical protein